MKIIDVKKFKYRDNLAKKRHRRFLALNILWLAGVSALVATLGYAVFFSGRGESQSASQTTVSDTSGFLQGTPAPTPQDYVAAQKGFQYLVSYTDQGFAPPTLSVKKGETVRFTNNSDAPLQLSLTGTSLLAHSEYLEYTFTESGAFNYSDGTHKGIINVE